MSRELDRCEGEATSWEVWPDTPEQRMDPEDLIAAWCAERSWRRRDRDAA